MKKLCSVCGMPLSSKNDYPRGADMKTCDWCKYCGTEDAIHPYETLLRKMTTFIHKTQGMDRDEAKKAAKEVLKNSLAAKDGRLKID